MHKTDPFKIEQYQWSVTGVGDDSFNETAFTRNVWTQCKAPARRTLTIKHNFRYRADFNVRVDEMYTPDDKHSVWAHFALSHVQPIVQDASSNVAQYIPDYGAIAGDSFCSDDNGDADKSPVPEGPVGLIDNNISGSSVWSPVLPAGEYTFSFWTYIMSDNTGTGGDLTPVLTNITGEALIEIAPSWMVQVTDL